jgi:hypothetical protein
MSSQSAPSPIQIALANLKTYAAKLNDPLLTGLLQQLEQAMAVTAADSGGDTISTGTVRDNKGVAIGKGISLSYTEGADPVQLAQTFQSIYEKLAALPAQNPDVTPLDAQDASAEVALLEEAAAQGEGANPDFVAARMRNLARMGPDILDVVTATLVNPGVGIATVLRKIATRAREEAGLEPAT